ncbi:MAG: type II toxin-antitoxin system RelE/ParE family toxin, partial [Desulfobacterota bacterium]|nr:type II toxin-antitoxin system RelE/ParE family toxin [Thermodesulfobacteriota bacterium]
MIKTFRSKHTEKIFLREPVPQFSQDVCRKALRKLLVLDAAERLNDLRIPPGNHLEKLAGDRQGQYSIRINDQ